MQLQCENGQRPKRLGPERGRWKPRRWLLWMPASVQRALRAAYHRYQIRRGRFTSDDPAFKSLDHLLEPGATALDIGANLGRYTLRMAELVGENGHVLAFEPVPDTFELLARHVRYAGCKNVSLFQMAVADRCGIQKLVLPVKQTGLAAHYFAHLLAPGEEANDEILTVYCCTIDSLSLSHPPRLVKIDVEGDEPRVLAGMRETLAAARPFVLVEVHGSRVPEMMANLGYNGTRLGGSQDWLFWPPEGEETARRAIEAVAAAR